eukprot:8069247-Alexandrium_andersonii.AAC.1
MKPSKPPAPTMHHARRCCSAASASASRSSQSKAGDREGGDGPARALGRSASPRALPSGEL